MALQIQQQVQLQVSRTSLETAIATAQAKVESDYTQDSWLAMQTALNAAITADSNANATQSDIDTAALNLTSNVAGLRPAPVVTPVPPEEITPSPAAVLQDAASALLGKMWEFVKWIINAIIPAPVKQAPASLLQSAGSLASELGNFIRGL